MPVTKITCPECGHTFPTSAGGRTKTCPKCEAEFIAGDTSLTGGPDEVEGGPAGKSYRSSPLRFAVLAGLVVVMGVLGYMLWEKKKKEREDAAKPADTEERDEPAPRPAPAPKGDGKAEPKGGGGGALIAPGGPKGGVSPAEISRRMSRVWEYKAGGATTVLEYKNDGTFTYSAPGAAAVSGKWVVEKVGMRNGADPAFAVSVKWTVDGQTIEPGQVYMKSHELESHPLIHKPSEKVMFEAR